ncbi:HTTM domain-containing protein [Natronobacterium gregoryi]|uniref:HTTM domain-containing protein n=2 Tax=Natronobacterium gregoryi TaxID=44930 RepID=L0AEH7_NATGS|nr:HTTM domain-containing protein [Natronobacterium gregoryi]AFZ71465.1 Vitamin K-dependent gamma-carboxylase [Natronobacterium gregoryi SP2]ELY66767.1 HTTM domain-containing protein [Natronobacterium gregoryi SP2]PLK19941.1 HTTM domain-containing protein [Natronobacterium gregoryi SP2]SFJ36368.1 Vitamin K-dependent gamma-carboxylase [Natronobacterium gregoryi]
MSPSTAPTDSGLSTIASIHKTAKSTLEPRLGIDPRALAAFRIAIGLVVLADLLLVRFPGVTTFYTDDGVFPRSTLAELYPAFETVSLHALSGGVWLQVLLLAIGVVAAVSLTVGYRARLATLVSALLLASLHARNPLVLNGGDTILLSLLVLGVFLPLERRWAIDAGSRADDGDSRLFSLATATILVHFVTIYAVNGALKFQSDSWMDGTATPRVFQLEQFVVWLGPWIAELESLLVVSNWVWTALLCGSVLLLVVTDRLRIALVSSFIVAQFGLAATMRLGVFPFVMVAALLLFLPPQVWDRLERIADPATVLPSAERPDAGLEFPPGLRRGARTVRSVFLVAFLVTIVGWQLAGAGLVDPPSSTPGELEDASWSFFAPSPPDAYWWYAWEADFEGGETVGTLVDEDGKLDRPPDAAARDPSVLWKRYGSELRAAGRTPYEPLAAYRCEQATDEYDDRPESLAVYYVEQPVTTDGPVGEPSAERRLEYAC